MVFLLSTSFVVNAKSFNLKAEIPVDGYVMSGFNSYPGHSGVDIIAPEGTDVVAVLDGTISKVDIKNPIGYGTYILINHDNGVQTLYAHMDNTIFLVGDKVSKGEKIGELGLTNISEKAYLHFEFIINEEHQNPENHINFI